MSNTGHVLPQQKKPKLIVVAAFNRNEDGRSPTKLRSFCLDLDS